MTSSPVVEAGAVVVKVDRGIPLYLLVTSKRDRSHWLFPKGHVEAGETTAEAAIREAEEEAGVVGEAIDPVGSSQYQFEGKDIRVEYFVVRYLKEVPTSEKRGIRWCTYDDATRQFSFSELQDILRLARPLVEKHFDESRAH